MIIELKVAVSIEEDTHRVDLTRYGMTSEKWEGMSEQQREDWLYDNVVNEYDPPSWCIDSFEKL